MRTRHRPHPSFFHYSPLVAALAMALAPHPAGATTKTVTTGADGIDPRPAGSLREAIEYFNGHTLVGDIFVSNCTGSDVINFSGGPFTVALSTGLPTIFCNGLSIQGSPGIAINGGNTPANNSSNDCGLDSSIPGRKITVSGLEIFGFTYGSAICGNFDASSNTIHNNDTGLFPHHGATITGNVIYTNVTGIWVSYGGNNIVNNTIYGHTLLGSGSGIDVEIRATESPRSVAITNNRIGLNTAGAPQLNDFGIYLDTSSANISGNNVISGNTFGIYLINDLGSTISNNKIGTNGAGDGGAGNSYGIHVDPTSAGLTISNNTISANSTGVALNEASNVVLDSNNIGTSADGMSGLGNTIGVIAECASNVSVKNNTISGNSTGIEFGAIQGGGTLDIVGNKIGVKGDGVTALGNGSYGILLRSLGCEVFPPVPGTTDGLMVKSNVIANNGARGLRISGGNNNTILQNTIHDNANSGIWITSGAGNRILQNSIYNHSVKGIDLSLGEGNNGQSYPSIDSVITDGSMTTVAYTLNSSTGTYRIDLYSNPTPGNPEGKTHRGTTSLTLLSGAASGSFAVSALSDPAAENFSLTATSNSGNSPGDTSELSPVVSVILAPGVSVSPPGLDFGNVATGSTSPPQTVTIGSNGSLPYHISSLANAVCGGLAICYGGPFMCSTDCSTSTAYAPGSSCTITARYAPTSVSSDSTTLKLCDDAAGSPRTITFTGSGVVPPPVMIVPSSWNFGDTIVGKLSDVKSFNIINPGPVDVPIGPVKANGEFLVKASTCGTTIPAHASCGADVVFAPTLPGATSGSLEVAAGGSLGSSLGMSGKVAVDGPPPSPAIAPLSGNGIHRAQLDMPSSVDMGAYVLGDPGLNQLVEVRSTGDAVAGFISVSVTPPFTVANGCPVNIPPGTSCFLTLGFTTTTLGDYSGTLTAITGTGAGGSREIPVKAHAVMARHPEIVLSTNSMGFGDRLLGTTSASQHVIISNNGSADAVLSSLTTTNLDFLVSSNCGQVLAPQSTCFADVSLRPVGFGPRNAQLTFTSNADGSPHTVNLSGTGCRPFGRPAGRLGSSFNCSP